jgi:hypothetical protein
MTIVLLYISVDIRFSVHNKRVRSEMNQATCTGTNGKGSNFRATTKEVEEHSRNNAKGCEPGVQENRATEARKEHYKKKKY